MCLAAGQPCLGFEKSGLILNEKEWVFTRRLPTKMILPLRRRDIKVTNQRGGQYVNKYKRYKKETINVLPIHPTHNNIQCSSDFPCCRPTVCPALKIYFIIQGELIYSKKII